MKPTVEQTFRTNDVQDGRPASYRFTYKPNWSPSKPWCVYWLGTATNQFPTLREALRNERLSLNAFSPEDQKLMQECMDYRTPTKQVLEGGEYVTMLDGTPA